MKILLVEDSTTQAKAILEILPTSFDVTVADDVGNVPEDTYGVVLLDLQLMTTSGTDTVRAFRTVQPSAPLVVLTSVQDAEVYARCLIEGANTFCEKSLALTHPDYLLRSMQAAILHQAARLGTLELVRQARDLAAEISKMLDDLVSASSTVDELKTVRNLFEEVQKELSQ